jgi:hypothetical protein
MIDHGGRYLGVVPISSDNTGRATVLPDGLLPSGGCGDVSMEVLNNESCEAYVSRQSNALQPGYMTKKLASVHTQPHTNRTKSPLLPCVTVCASSKASLSRLESVSLLCCGSGSVSSSSSSFPILTIPTGIKTSTSFEKSFVGCVWYYDVLCMKPQNALDLFICNVALSLKNLPCAGSGTEEYRLGVELYCWHIW